MEETSAVHLVCISSEVLFVDTTSLLPTKAAFYTALPQAPPQQTDLTKPLRLKSSV